MVRYCSCQVWAVEVAGVRNVAPANRLSAPSFTRFVRFMFKCLVKESKRAAPDKSPRQAIRRNANPGFAFGGKIRGAASEGQ